MNRLLAAFGILALTVAVACFQAQTQRTPAMADETAAQPMLAHMVYFTLKEDSPANRQTLIDSCYRYLKEHPGVVFFGAGPRDASLSREVNDQDFHVGLHVVFKDRKAHDDYQVAESHQKFIEENKASWQQVRVFDAFVR